jgi:hypothetical protein
VALTRKHFVACTVEKIAAAKASIAVIVPTLRIQSPKHNMPTNAKAAETIPSTFDDVPMRSSGSLLMTTTDSTSIATQEPY